MIRSTPALQAAAEWLDSGATAIVLIGGTGTSKTTAARWLFDHLAARRLCSPSGSSRGPVWWSAKAIPASGDSRERETWQAYDSATIVCIDDAGTEQWAERVSSAIERAFDIAPVKRIVITTNMARGPFVARFGDRVESRLLAAHWISLACPDYRDTPPIGAAWPLPTDPTPRELAETAARETAALEEEVELERTRPAREAAAARAFAEIRDIIAKLDAEKTIARSADDRHDDDRRRFLRQQVRLVQHGGDEQ